MDEWRLDVIIYPDLIISKRMWLPDWYELSGIHMQRKQIDNYRQTSNIRRALVENIIVDHSDVVGASPVGAAPTTSSFST